MMQTNLKPIIQTQALSHRFSTSDVLDELSLAIPQGSICGLMGRNGCGKTTLLRLLIGTLHPYKGSSRVLGLDPRRNAVEIRRRVGYMPQESDYDPEMTVQQTIDFIRPFYGDYWNEDELQRQLQRFELTDLEEIPVRYLSVGLRQRLALAITLAPEPELLLLDEPTAGLDAVVRHDFAEAVVEYMSVPERTVVLSSHLLNELERLVDHVVFLEGGKQLLAASLDDLKEHLMRLEVMLPKGLDDVEFPDSVEILSHYEVDDTLHVSVWNTGAGQVDVLKQHLEGLGAKVTEVGEASLDSIFVDLMRN